MKSLYKKIGKSQETIFGRQFLGIKITPYKASIWRFTIPAPSSTSVCNAMTLPNVRAGSRRHPPDLRSCVTISRCNDTPMQTTVTGTSLLAPGFTSLIKLAKFPLCWLLTSSAIFLEFSDEDSKKRFH
jgi:hypothetical protein